MDKSPIFDSNRPLNRLRNEDDVKLAIVSFLEQLHPPYEILTEPSLDDAGFADIAVPKSRLVIETKHPRSACGPDVRERDTTQLGQLTRYVTKFRELEESDLFAKTERSVIDRNWVGVLTNGKSWWAWEWDDESGVRGEIEGLSESSYSGLIDTEIEKFALRKSGKSWIPENPLTAFDENRDGLDQVHEQSSRMRSLPTQKAIWEELIRGSGIPILEDRKEKLYLDHVFLLAICRMVVSALGRRSDDPERILQDGFGGWLGETQSGQRWLQDMHSKVMSFNWTARKSDVLRNLYENLIDRDDRKLFGEYYTPDWLAGLVVEDVLDAAWLRRSIRTVYEESATVAGVGVLDPCCGSGSFLYAAARRISNAIPKVLGEVDLSDQADIVLRLVVGIDIHPLAVEMAQATLMRAIEGQPTVEAQVFQGDSLLMDRYWAEGQLAGLTPEDAMFEFPKNSGNMFSIPYEITDQADMTKRLRLIVNSAKAKGAMPKGSIKGLNAQHRDMLREAHTKLTEIIEKHGNGVWTWFIRNQLAPYAIHKRKVDRIVSNPPWLRFSEIQTAERKEEVRGKAKELGIWVGGQNATSFDLACLFAVETQELYLENPSNRSAYVLNHAALTARSWTNFRDGVKEFDDQGKVTSVRSYTDTVLSLSEKDHFDGALLRERPFHGADACVIGLSNRNPLERLTLKDASERINRSMDWATAKPLVKRSKKTTLTNPRASYYAEMPRNGATLFPNVLIVIDPNDSQKTYQPTLAKEPWKKLEPFHLEDIPDHWVKDYVGADNLRSFGLEMPLQKAIVPTNPSGELLSEDEAKSLSKTWQALQNEYELKAGIGPNNPGTLLKRINYGNGWSSQFPLKTSVFYNASGQILRAVVEKRPIEHKLYRILLDSVGECHYLCAILNAKSLSRLFVLSRESDRDFDKNPLRKIPIPQFDRSNADHVKLANLSKQLHGRAHGDQGRLTELSEIAESVFLSANPRGYRKYIRSRK